MPWVVQPKVGRRQAATPSPGALIVSLRTRRHSVAQGTGTERRPGRKEPLGEGPPTIPGAPSGLCHRSRNRNARVVRNETHGADARHAIAPIVDNSTTRPTTFLSSWLPIAVSLRRCDGRSGCGCAAVQLLWRWSTGGRLTVGGPPGRPSQGGSDGRHGTRPPGRPSASRWKGRQWGATGPPAMRQNERLRSGRACPSFRGPPLVGSAV